MVEAPIQSEALLAGCPELARWLRERVAACAGVGPWLSPLLGLAERAAGMKGDRLDDFLLAIDGVLVRIDALLADQLDLIVHHPAVTGLFASWLGVHALCESAGEDRLIQIDLLSTTREALIEDFATYPDLSESALFHHLYKTEYDQAGGNPYASVLLQFNFGLQPVDTWLLKQLSAVAASCHCPVIANADPALFGVKTFAELENIKDFPLLFSGREYTRWHSLSESEDARYLGLTLPRVRLNVPLARRPPRFCRGERFDDAGSAWCHGSYAFGKLLVQSFIRHGWCIYIRGPRTGGLVGGIQGDDLGNAGYELREIPLEIDFSDRQERDIAALGLIPLAGYGSAGRICIFSAPSLQRVAAEPGTTGGPGGGSYDRLAASLPYLYLIARIAHYQKSMQRENLGLVKDGHELQNELDRWLKTLITRMPDPDQEMRSRFPLRDGRITVGEDPATPGFFNVHLLIQPHLQLEGINTQLTLLSKMPRKE